MKRILSNGDITFPHRGEAPKFVPGYIPDDNDPWIFHPIVKECRFRCFKTEKLKCCGKEASTSMYCNLFKRTITWKDCMSCDKSEQ